MANGCIWGNLSAAVLHGKRKMKNALYSKNMKGSFTGNYSSIHTIVLPDEYDYADIFDTSSWASLSGIFDVHDEVVVLVPESEVSEGMPWVYDQMVKEPPYMPGIPLKAEIGHNRRYGDAKQ